MALTRIILFLAGRDPLPDRLNQPANEGIRSLQSGDLGVRDGLEYVGPQRTQQHARDDVRLAGPQAAAVHLALQEAGERAAIAHRWRLVSLAARRRRPRARPASDDHA